MGDNYFRVIPVNKRKRSFFVQFIKNLNLTSWLIITNVFFFILFSILGVLSNSDCGANFCKYIALQPYNLFVNNYWWTLLSSMFMHAGFFHLFVNMFSLYFIGNFLEMLIGKKRLFWMYMLSGIFAGIFFSILAFFLGTSELGARLLGSPETYAVGASGAIFAIAGVLALLTPRNKVYLLMGPMIAIVAQFILLGFVKSAAIYNLLDIAVSIYIFVCIFTMFTFNPRTQRIALPVKMPFWVLPIVAIVPLFVIGLFFKLPIGNMAHLGGFIGGALYGLYLRIKYKKKTQAIARHFS